MRTLQSRQYLKKNKNHAFRRTFCVINQRKIQTCLLLHNKIATNLKSMGFPGKLHGHDGKHVEISEKNVDKKLFEKENDYVDGSKKNPRVCLQQTKWHVQGAEH